MIAASTATEAAAAAAAPAANLAALAGMAGIGGLGGLAAGAASALYPSLLFAATTQVGTSLAEEQRGSASDTRCL